MISVSICTGHVVRPRWPAVGWRAIWIEPGWGNHGVPVLNGHPLGDRAVAIGLAYVLEALEIRILRRVGHPNGKRLIRGVSVRVHRVAVATVDRAVVDTHDVVVGIVVGVWWRILGTLDNSLGLDDFGSDGLDQVGATRVNGGIHRGAFAGLDAVSVLPSFLGIFLLVALLLPFLVSLLVLFLISFLFVLLFVFVGLLLILFLGA